MHISPLNDSEKQALPAQCPYLRTTTTAPGCPAGGKFARAGDVVGASARHICSHAEAASAPGTILLVGVNHHTAPVELRERFCQGGELADMLKGLREAGFAEAAILFTCNRFEVYVVTDEANHETLVAYLAARCGMQAQMLSSSLYHASGAAAALHLMRVAAGLESVVLGEPQILGQVADALAYGREHRTLGPLLTRLFTSAVHAGKRARSETAIGRHTLSISHAAILLLKSRLDLARARVAVVGAGEMGRLAVRALAAHGAGNVSVINRTFARAAELCDGAKVCAAPWEHLPRVISNSDAVIAVTSASAPIIRQAELVHRDASRPLHLVDLAVPRNVDPECAGVNGVCVHNVDDLERVVESHRLQRQQEASRVEQLLHEELDDYLEWIEARRLAPLIVGLREHAKAHTDAQIEKTLRRLSPDLSDETRAIIEQMARRISGGLLHAATVALKESRTGTPAPASSGAAGGSISG